MSEPAHSFFYIEFKSRKRKAIANSLADPCGILADIAGETGYIPFRCRDFLFTLNVNQSSGIDRTAA